ncbi:hypothetical protein N8487_00220 [bacterium]|jgi:hypothetical protein|nr:hypothetical protein [bacterium]MDA7633152.1 hypothetical protein [bacterium]MDB4745822.1 hypothetical protein [Verrucomicrobiota bacterium]MDB4798305.1 hypothetical protein [Verrucomicrobiota bacterium]
MEEPKHIHLESITEFESITKIDGETVMVPYPGPEQLASLAIALTKNAPNGASPAKAAFKLWEECFIEIAKHKSRQKKVSDIKKELGQAYARIKLPDPGEFPMKLDKMLGRISGSKTADRFRHFKEHLRAQPQLDGFGNVVIDKEGQPVLRTEDEVQSLLGRNSEIRTQIQYLNLAEPFKRYLTEDVPKQKALKGANAKKKKTKALKKKPWP